jgi:membrane-bound lytic murein transglycosylase A
VARLFLALTLIVGLAACRVPRPEPDYSRPLPDGAPALLPLGPDEPLPDFSAEWHRRDATREALAGSLSWMAKPSARSHFPAAGIDFDRALSSLQRFSELLDQASSGDDFSRRLQQEFTVYKSAGWDGRGGGVLFTGYYTPILDGSRDPTDTFRYPLYALPPDLVKDEQGRTLGRQTAMGMREGYPSRGTIERTGMLADKGLELAWMRDPFDAYIAHVNGSAVLRLRDGSLMRLGYAGNNGHEYTSMREQLVRDRKIDSDTANLVTMRQWAAAHPDEVEGYMHRNRRYVFFTPIHGNPRGSLNVEVTPERTLATDKALFPRAAIVYVDASVGGPGAGKPFTTFMFDQDTGGAIRTAGRADIYLGTGRAAERLAGTTQNEGQLYYLFLNE